MLFFTLTIHRIINCFVLDLYVLLSSMLYFLFGKYLKPLYSKFINSNSTT